MSGLVRKLTATASAIALVAVPTGAIAAAPPAAPQPAVQQAAPVSSTDPWLALSAMTSTSSSAAATAAAAQGERGPGFPPIPVLAVILATIGLAIWILVSDDEDDLDFIDDEEPPVSPA